MATGNLKGLRRGSIRTEISPLGIIKNLYLNLSSSDLLIVSGPVGSGKTTLLLSILQETTLLSGTMDVRGKIAYVSSDPFIFTGSILDNILFGERYEEERLEKVLELCQLKKDLELYPDNLQTIVGEKGLNISIG